MWVLCEKLIVVWQDALHELVLLLGLRLDHVLAVVRVEEELTRLGVRDKLDEIIITYNRTRESRVVSSDRG